MKLSSENVGSIQNDQNSRWLWSNEPFLDETSFSSSLLIPLIFFEYYRQMAHGDMITNEQWEFHPKENFDESSENEGILPNFVGPSYAVIPEGNRKNKKKIEVIDLFKPEESCFPDRLCTNSKLYPREAIKTLLMRENYKKKFAHLSGSVIKPSRRFSMKVRDSLEYKNLCKTRKVSRMPSIGFNSRMKPKYIVNVEEYNQTIIHRICQNEGQPCSEKDVWPYNFKTCCQQEYSMVRLLAVNYTGGLEYAYFQVPSTCYCSYIEI
ncbi:hypothetical protein JTB14_036482 [Gonioctena quinquepunctata]|nr:hypothetical protein JTB14_036482 [Gonioctena quinquepunctata]